MRERQNFLSEPKDSFRRYALILLVLGVLTRLPAFLQPRSLPVVIFFDGSYLNAARDILHFDFHALGQRVPVYPLFLLLCGLKPRAIWIAQSLLGIASSLLIYSMAYRRTRDAKFAAVVGFAGSLAPEVLSFESSIMTETLASFLLVLAVWLIFRYNEVEKPPLVYPIGLGTLAGVMTLNRIAMISLLPVLFLALVPVWPVSNWLRRETWRKALAFSVPALALILGWCGLVHRNSGRFALTTVGGHNLMDQVDPWVELAPPRFAVLRDNWIRYREITRATNIQNVNPVFDRSVAAISAATGRSPALVGSDYEALARYLMIHHPGLYLRRAEQGWIQFWADPTRDEMVLPDAGSVSPSDFLLTFSDFMVQEVKAIFLVLALIAIPCLLIRSRIFSRLEYLIFILVLWNSVFCALTEYGENRRFVVPFYLLILYLLMTRAWIWVRAASSRPDGDAPGAF